MTFLALTLGAPFAAALIILAVRRAPAALALMASGLAMLGSLGLLLTASRGLNSMVQLPGLPSLPLILDAGPLTSLLSVLVSTVAGFVLIYAIGYMRQDPEKPRFFATMLFFVTAMQTLVLAGDWITLLAAWELIGFSSYLLIGFWHGRKDVPAAATRAFLYTRSADLGLYVAAFALIGASGTSRIDATLGTSGVAALVAGFGFLIAAMGKSAQVPLQNWLQGAMAGPTPVSALLHSATLVAAGAILLIRAAPMLPASVLLAIGVVGGITTVVTGMIALAERDLKRLLAASTSSQYGLMLVAVGAGVPVAALLHLIAHAAIKSALFLGAGVFQHDRESTTLTDLKGAARARPGIFAAFALAALALAGVPPLAGFFSKDAVIAAAISAPGFWWLAPFAMIGTLLTGAYMARALSVLWKRQSDRSPQADRVDRAPWMGAGLGGLAFFAAVLGGSFGYIEELLGTALTTGVLASALGLAAAMTGLALGWFATPAQVLGPLYGWAGSGFVVAGGIDGLVLRPVLALARLCETLDQRIYNAALGAANSTRALATLGRRNDEGAIDGVIFALVSRTKDAGTRVRRLQTGLIHRELALSVLGIAILAALLLAAPLYS